MADIFLSYAREDKAKVARIVEQLTQLRWSVFWDRELPVGKEWPEALRAELEKARCVVVLWTQASVASEWVAIEAAEGRERGVLVPAFGQKVKPLRGFEAVHAADLADWDGDPQAHGFQSLVKSVTELIGGYADIRLWPSEVVAVTADKVRYPELSPTINMTCVVTNQAKEPVVLRRLEITASASDGGDYHMPWYLFYGSAGYRHSKIEMDARIDIPGKSTWRQGVQFRESLMDKSSVWPAGDYSFEMLGWFNRNPASKPPNLRTRFQTRIGSELNAEIRRWREADTEQWDRFGDPDRARGFMLMVSQVRAGL